MESTHSYCKSYPTNETVTFFLYNSIKSATHSLHTPVQRAHQTNKKRPS